MSGTLRDYQLKRLGARLSNRGRRGDDDQFGTVRFITPEGREQLAAGCHQDGVRELPFSGIGIRGHRVSGVADHADRGEMTRATLHPHRLAAPMPASGLFWIEVEGS
jgi:hypothetical protein